MSQIIAHFQADPIQKIGWASLTAFTAFSMFPRPPKAYADWISKHEWVQWLCVFTLCLQGQSLHDPYSAALITALIYLAFKLIDKWSMQKANTA